MFTVYIFFSSHSLFDFIKLKLHLYQDQDGRDLIVVCLCLQGAYFQRQAGGLNFEIISMFSLAILSSVWRQKASNISTNNYVANPDTAHLVALNEYVIYCHLR